MGTKTLHASIVPKLWSLLSENLFTVSQGLWPVGFLTINSINSNHLQHNTARFSEKREKSSRIGDVTSKISFGAKFEKKIMWKLQIKTKTKCLQSVASSRRDTGKQIGVHWKKKVTLAKYWKKIIQVFTMLVNVWTEKLKRILKDKHSAEENILS